MISRKENPEYKKWLIFNTCGLLLIFFASTAAPIAPYIWEGFYGFLYKATAVLLIGFYVFFRHKDMILEEKIVFAYIIWLIASRILNGDMILSTDGENVLNITISCMFMPLILLLPEDKRLKTLDFGLIVVGIMFTLGAVFGIYYALTQKLIVNPLSQWYVAYMDMESARIYTFGSNPNISGFWMMCGVFIFIYLFLRHKNWMLRTLYVIAAILNYIAIALSVSRNAMVGFSISAAAFVLMLLLHHLHIRKNAVKVLVVAAVILTVSPISYKCFSYVTHAAGIAANYIISNQEQTDIPAQTDSESGTAAPNDILGEKNKKETSNDMYDDHRGFSDSGRLEVYKHAGLSIKEEPMRLLRGCMYEDIVKIYNEYLNTLNRRNFGHFHNSFIQTLEYTGIPGFVLTLAFWILLIIRSFRLFFTEDPRAGLPIKTLITILPGIFVHNMLETSAFNFMDFRSAFFFIISGAVIVYSYEICPPKGRVI